MIAIGFTATEKDAEIQRYVGENAIKRTIIFSPRRHAIRCSVEHEVIEYDEIIMYRTYYPLIQRVDRDTLLVINECRRTPERNDLTYNCIRNFLQQTPHQLVFQYLPIAETDADFMTLFDFDTRSRWKREPWSVALIREASVVVRLPQLELQPIEIETDMKTRGVYEREKRRLIDGLGMGDPHTVPRNLYQLSGRTKLGRVRPGAQYVGRNNRFKIPTLRTYREAEFPEHSTVFELPHSFLDFADFLALSRQTTIPVLVADLKVDRWYFERFTSWLGRVRDACAALHG